MSEATGSKPYSEDEAYLYETYVTEDGIEVPPPTKVMGPRRLARYREEVAEYLRAARRGEPAKPVANMGSVIHADAIDPQVLAVQRRLRRWRRRARLTLRRTMRRSCTSLLL